MLIKRIMFVVILALIGGCCYIVMNQRFDPLARYPYALKVTQRELLLNTLENNEIAFLISEKIKPEEILPFIEQADFNIENTRWYGQAFTSRSEDYGFVVKFINKYKDVMQYRNVADLLRNYSYNTLISFFDETEQLNPDLELYPNADDPFAIIGKNDTLFIYEPLNLIKLENIVYDNMLGSDYIYVCDDVQNPLQDMLSAANDTSQFNSGTFYAVAGYISYENQYNLYLQAHNTASEEQNDTTWDFPGQSEFQLGKTIRLELRDCDLESDEAKDRIAWLKENAYRYGFVIRYPLGKEDLTGKSEQPLTLRYVGKKYAKSMSENNKVMEETKFEN